MNNGISSQSNLGTPLKPIVLNASLQKPKPKTVTMSKKGKKNTTNFIMSGPIARWGPIKFEDFVGILKNYDILIKEGDDLERAGASFNPTFGTITQNHIYEDGVSKLLRVSFVSEEDATTSIKIVIQRAFNQFSAVVKNRKKNKDGNKVVSVGYDCTRAIYKKGDKAKTGKCEKCHWKAVLKPMEDGSFQFTSIGTLESHVPKCLEGCSNNITPLLDHLSKMLDDHGKDLRDFEMFNETFSRKTNYTIPKNRVCRHINHKKWKAAQIADKEKYIDIYNPSEGNLNSVSTEDKVSMVAPFSSIEETNEFGCGCGIPEEDNFMGFCEAPEEQTIYAIPVPPKKALCTSIGKTPSSIYGIYGITEEEKPFP